MQHIKKNLESITMNRVAKKSTRHFKAKKETSTFCANCCQPVEMFFPAPLEVSTKTALHIIYNLDYNKNHFTNQEPEVVVLCEKCHSIFVNLFKFYSQFNGLRQVTSYLHKQIQHLDSLLQQIESPNNHPIKSEENDDDASGGKNVNSDIDDDDVKMEISSTEEVNSDSDEEFYPADKDDLTYNDVTYSPAVESEDDTSSHSDSDDPLKIEQDEVTGEQESGSTINSCHGSESDLSSSTQSDLTKNFVRVKQEKKVQNNTVIDLVTPEEEDDGTQLSKQDLNIDCKKCCKSFRSLKNLQNHQRYCNMSTKGPSGPVTKEYPCTVPGCNKIVNFYNALLNHQKAAHFVFIGDKVTCTICQASLKRHSWSQHVKTHEENRPRCPKCHHPCTKGEYQLHIESCKGKKLYSCDICGQNNLLYATFKSHMAGHTGEIFKCPMPNCDKKFANKYLLRHHVQRHDPSNQFTCPDPNCGRIFKVKKSLTSHILGTHPHLVSSIQVESQLCPVCGLTILGSHRLKVHMRIHREATFQCHVCPKAFKNKPNLDHHLARHEGNRTVPCTFEGCTKLFYNSGEVRNHMKTHTGEKNHVCTICGRASADAGNLRKHMLIHSQVKQFKCHLCDKAYKQPQMLKTHLKTHQK